MTIYTVHAQLPERAKELQEAIYNLYLVETKLKRVWALIEIVTDDVTKGVDLERLRAFCDGYVRGKGWQ